VDDNDTGPRPVEVVGVVGDVKQFGLDAPPTYDVYAALHQAHPDGFHWIRNNQFWVVRTSGNPLGLAEVFRRELRSIDPDVPASDLQSLEQYLTASLAPRRFNLRLILTFAATALLLACMGVYGTVSYGVAQRTQEIGIRLALGALPRDIFRLVVSQGMRLTLAGVGLGLIGALGLTRFLSSLLYGVSPADPVTYVGIALLLLGISLLACYVPARRATQVDPMTALRYE
jgi:ABC-type antimicrobial peptide transport system permease subunit